MSYTSENRSHQVELDQPGASSRRRADKGLPNDKALLDLARTYLEIQHRLWPMLVACGLLPEITESEIETLAVQFRERFLNGSGNRFQPDIDSPPWTEIGAAYVRYSCDNSNPRSLDQQLRNALELAARDKVYIPWENVFADAAVTGTIATRRGYIMVKELIRDKQATLRRVYIDEIGRASRDAIEALKLGRLIEHRHKRLIGASDGFDSDTPNAKFLLSMYAMLHQWFVDQLRSKVNRGMSDAFDRGGNIRPPSLGYQLIPKLDVNGEPMFKTNGKPIREKVIDDVEAKSVQEMYHLYAEMHWSPENIARRFNDQKVAGKDGWDATLIQQALARETYIGIEYEGKTTRVRDPETEREIVVKRPRAEWKCRLVPHLRIISDELWQKAVARQKECSDAYDKTKKGNKEAEQPSRANVYPKTLLRPKCGYCGNELWLGRSGKYRSFACLNGRCHKKDCGLRTHKAVLHVENAILERIRNDVFTPKYLERVLAEANQFLTEQASRPPEDIEPLLLKIKQTKSKQDRLVKVLERDTLERDTAQELDSVVDQVRRHERRLNELRKELEDANARNIAPPPPITMTDLELMVSDLHAVLSQDVAVSAPLLAKMTGPITITEGKDQGRKGTPWIAKFKLDLTAALAALSRASDWQDHKAWELLHTHSVHEADQVEIVIDDIPKYEQIAPKVKELHDQKMDLTKIAKMFGVARPTADKALRFAKTGERPAPYKRKSEKPRDSTPKYRELAPIVAEMFDVEKLDFKEITTRLNQQGVKVSQHTVIDAHDHFHAVDIKNGKGRKRRKCPRLSAEKKQEIQQLLLAGDLSADQLTKQFCCGRSTINRVRRELCGSQESQVPTSDSGNQRRSA